jgi:hypothetical protein
MKRDFYESPKSTPLMRLFWKAAGADQYILERATYSDQIKYTCLGGIVVSTGVLAGIAGGYAFYTIFEPRGAAIESQFSWWVSLAALIFGAIWGLVIFNIDRFIVTSTGTGDGTEAITADEIKGALPRIIMGMIIALTISKPVEIRMFKSEIDVRLYAKQQEQEKEYEEKTRANFSERLKLIDQDLEAIRGERQQYLDRIRKAEKDYQDQLNGKVPGTIPGDGPLAKALERNLATIKAENNEHDQRVVPVQEDLERQRKRLLRQLDSELEKNSQVAGGLDGLLERLKLAHEVAGWEISLFITLLFMAIELTPIFFKLMLIKSPYDYLSDNVKELVKAERGIEVKYDYYQDKEGKERDLVVFHEAKRLITEKAALVEAQKELSDYAIGKWVERQKQLIDQDPSRFVRSDDETLRA